MNTNVILSSLSLLTLLTGFGCGDGMITAHLIVEASEEEAVTARLKFPVVYTFTLAPKGASEGVSGPRLDRNQQIYCGPSDESPHTSLYVHTRCEELWITVSVAEVILADPDVCNTESDYVDNDDEMIDLEVGKVIGQTEEVAFKRKDCLKDFGQTMELQLQLVD